MPLNTKNIPQPPNVLKSIFKDVESLPLRPLGRIRPNNFYRKTPRTPNSPSRRRTLYAAVIIKRAKATAAAKSYRQCVSPSKLNAMTHSPSL